MDKRIPFHRRGRPAPGTPNLHFGKELPMLPYACFDPSLLILDVSGDAIIWWN